MLPDPSLESYRGAVLPGAIRTKISSLAFNNSKQKQAYFLKKNIYNATHFADYAMT